MGGRARNRGNVKEGKEHSGPERHKLDEEVLRKV